MIKSISAMDIMSQMSEFIIFLDKEGMILFVNAPALDTLGYKETEILNKPVNSICQTFPLKFENVEPTKSIPAEYKAKDGANIPVIMSFLKFHMEGGEQGYIVTANDNREQMALQKKLSEIVGELEHTVQSLKKSEEMRLGYISMVYHELRSPLTSAKGALSLIISNLSSSFTDTQKELLNIAKVGHERLLRMIEELRDVSKIESGTFSVDRYNFDLNRTVDLAAALITGELAAKKLKIAKKFKLQELIMCGDENRIIQVIMNLLSNAIKFSNENGVIEIGTLKTVPGPDGAGGYFAEKADRDKEYTMLYVRDYGRGIKKEYIDKVFGRYFQVKTEDASKYKGMGLGLTIVKGIVEAHGGFVWVESEGEGKGSVFKVIFPETAAK